MPGLSFGCSPLGMHRDFAAAKSSRFMLSLDLIEQAAIAPSRQAPFMEYPKSLC